VFPARYELNSYIVFRKRLVSKRLRHQLLRPVSQLHFRVCLYVREPRVSAFERESHSPSRGHAHNFLPSFSQHNKQVTLLRGQQIDGKEEE
jgi:hypothetical protein